MRFVSVLSLMLALLCVGCNQGKGPKGTGQKNVVCTTGMIADAAKNIGGDKVEVIGLMSSGVDPHLYKATAGDVSRLRSADLILYNGLHLEAKMGEVLEKMGGQITTVAVADRIARERVHGATGEHDPHVWFDVQLWMSASEAIRDALVQVDPANRASFEANFAAYRKELEELDAYVRKRVAELPEEQRVLVTAHDAFSYFGAAYGFEVRGLQGISTVTEAGTADMQSLAQFIADRKIGAIFIESSVARRNVEALQAAVKSRGFDVKIGGELFSDAMGDAGTEKGTYLGMVRHNTDTIVDALSGTGK